MRRAAVALLVLALPAAGAAASPGRTAAPALHVVTEQPLVIDGTGFKRLEVVRVTATAGGDRATRRVTARRSGGFTARFPDFGYDPCHQVLVLRAGGTKGSLAWRKIPMRECPNGPG